MPDHFTVNRSTASAVEVLCIVLRRLAYPCRYIDIAPLFKRSAPNVCYFFRAGIDFIYENHSFRITDLNQPWMSMAHLATYSAAIVRKGSPLANCNGFIDGTVRGMCRPGRYQRAVYNGHHRMKFQAISLPNGLTTNPSDVFNLHSFSKILR